MKVEVQSAGIKRLAAKVDRRIYALSNTSMKQLLQSAGTDLVTEFRANIDAMTPGKVPDLKESTKKRKMKEVGFVYPILKRTQAMYNSMYTTVINTSRGMVIRLGFRGSDAKGVPNLKKAESHVQGSSSVPIRDFTSISRRWKAGLFQRVRDRLRST